MIYYALIVRTQDALPLSASTDVDIQMQKQINEVRRYIKLLTRQVGHLENRCSLDLPAYTIHFVSCLGLTFLVLCSPTYPTVLAFSFLTELQREFISIYDNRQISSALRPYAFIEFDTFILKTRHMYNNPRSLTTKINLNDLSTEIKLNPPCQLQMSDIKGATEVPVNVPSQAFSVTNFTPSVPWYMFPFVMLSAVCALFLCYRGISALSESTLEELDGTSPIHGLLFLFEASIYCIQIYLLFFNQPWWKELSYSSILGIVISNIMLSSIQDWWQGLARVAISGIMLTLIHIQHPVVKLSNYNV